MQADGPGMGRDTGRESGARDQRKRWRRLAVALSLVVAAGGAGTAAAVFDSHAGASPHRVATAALPGEGSTTTAPTTAPATTTTAPATTTAPTTLPPTTATPALSQPAPPPADPHAPVPVTAVGEISIPKIGLDTTYYEGVWLTVIDVGPGHWPGTASAGGYGNMVLAGHRVTHSHPFRNIDQLVPGDDIFVRDATGTYTYRVTGSEVVTPDQLWIVDQKPGHEITLFACHPPGSATYRYVVHGELVS
jgi:sortase A